MTYKFFIPQLMVLLFRIFNFQVCRALCRQHKGGARADPPRPSSLFQYTRRNAYEERLWVFYRLHCALMRYLTKLFIMKNSICQYGARDISHSHLNW